MDSIEFNDKIINRWSPEALSDKLYVAIRANDTARIERLRAEGITLSDHIKDMLTIGGGSHANYQKYGLDWYNFNFNLSKYSPREFITVIRNLYAELDKPICYTDTVGSKIPEFYSPEVFKCVLDCFDNKKIPKKQTLQQIINNNSVELLEIAAEHGWFRFAKKCDEYIEYAHEKNRTECAAWLLDFKNRTFDLQKEREKAEKKAERELNAAPGSVTALKAFWKYRKQKDGTLAITGYKGTQTEITIPERIGKSPVTALKLGKNPAGMSNLQRYFAQDDLVNEITKVTLPRGLVTIGNEVFAEFCGMKEIDIPDGVVSIGDEAFALCEGLQRLRVPDSATEIGANAFYNCSQLREINIPRGVTEIKKRTFAWCESIEKLKIPDTVKKIAEDAFLGCYSLERIDLPGSVEKIGKNAFYWCYALKEIVIPEGVCEIGETAFEGCGALERVVLPVSLKKAKNLIRNGEPPKTIFNDCPNVTAVVTPKSYAEKYCKRNNIPYVYKEN